jgi:hypothetical protein
LGGGLVNKINLGGGSVKKINLGGGLVNCRNNNQIIRISK